MMGHAPQKEIPKDGWCLEQNETEAFNRSCQQYKTRFYLFFSVMCIASPCSHTPEECREQHDLGKN